MIQQMDLFADDLTFVDTRPQQIALGDASPEEVARGRIIAAEIIADVVANPRPWGPLRNYTILHFGYDQRSKEVACGGDFWFCETYHMAPDPNAAAFDGWLEGGGYGELATCGAYRASYSWQVAHSVQYAAELSERTGYTFTIDATGAVAAPEDYRPEAPLVVGAIRRGARISRVFVNRAPRGYGVAQPAWLPKRGSDRVEYIRFLGPVCAWIEYATTPSEKRSCDDDGDDE